MNEWPKSAIYEDPKSKIYKAIQLFTCQGLKAHRQASEGTCGNVLT